MNRSIVHTKLTILLAIAMSMAPSLHAQEHKSSLGAHVHGLSELTIATEGKTLEVQLTSPAMNIVGFEHKATTKEELNSAENAASQLRQHDTLFVFSGTHCQHVTTSINMGALIENHDHEEHAHTDQHSEIIAHYQYRCENVETLSSVKVTLFESFPNIHEIHAMWVKQGQQGSKSIMFNQPVIRF